MRSRLFSLTAKSGQIISASLLLALSLSALLLPTKHCPRWWWRWQRWWRIWRWAWLWYGGVRIVVLVMAMVIADGGGGDRGLGDRWLW
jgi:hypothetical protein